MFSDEPSGSTAWYARFRTEGQQLIEPNCRHCTLFIDEPAAIELEFPSVRILGSFFASVRGSAGLCRDRDRFMDPIPAAECPAFLPRRVEGEADRS